MADFWSWSDSGVVLFGFTALALLLATFWIYRRLTAADKSEDDAKAEADKVRCPVIRQIRFVEELRAHVRQKESRRPAAIHGKALPRSDAGWWTEAKPYLLREYFDHLVKEKREVLEHILLDVTEELLHVMASRSSNRTSPGQQQQPTDDDDYSGRLFSCAFFVLQQVLLGTTRSDQDDEKTSEDLNAMHSHLKTLLRCWPQYDCAITAQAATLRFADEKTESGFKESKEKMLQHLREAVSRRLKERNSPAAAYSYVQYYFQQADLTRDDIVDRTAKHLLGLFVCGVEALQEALVSCLRLVADDPELQKKILGEITEAIGQKTSIYYLLESRAALPFTQAVIKEVFRMAIPVPFAAFYDEPGEREINESEAEGESRITVVDLKSISHDQEVWKNPEAFDPARFLDPLGEKLIEKDAYVPFYTGANSCPGQALAELSVFVILAFVLQRFSLKRSSSSGEASDAAAQKPLLLLSVSERTRNVL